MAIHRNDNLEHLVPKIDRVLGKIFDGFETGHYDVYEIKPDKAGLLAQRLIEARLRIAGDQGGAERALKKLAQHIGVDE